MKNVIQLSMLSVFMLVSPALAQDAVKGRTIPAGAEAASQVLKDSPRHGEWVDVALPGSDVKIKSWVVYPERKDKAGVVIVIHEIFGMTDWVRAVADQVAADGFIAIAPDLLSGYGPNGGGSEALGDKVREEIRKINPEEQAKRLDAIRDYALKLPSANGKSASIGFCWGGSASFNYASRQPKLTAAVVYYGSAPTDVAQIAKVECPVSGFYGGSDSRVNASLEATEAAMKAGNKTFTKHIFDGAGHGFLRQQTGQNGANMKASEGAWKETVEFLKKNLE